MHLLANQDIRCEVIPSLGGVISGLWFKDLPVLRNSPSALTNARQASCYVLLPYSNRIGQGRLNWQNKKYQLSVQPKDAPHSIHGVGLNRAWEIHDATNNQIILNYRHQPDLDWPFSFSAIQTIRLEENSLRLMLEVTNQHDTAVPIGAGWHPFFVKRPSGQIRFQAKGKWHMTPDFLPSHRSAATGLNGEYKDWQIDQCFDGWNGLVTIEDEIFKIKMESNLGCLVVYTQPQLNSIAIEPVSHVNNALQLVETGQIHAPGMHVVQPAERLSAWATIKINQ
jgi:aldose 1-epimerase